MSTFGYKAMHPDMTCWGMRYNVGETYRIDALPGLCEQGFHFCERAVDVWGYYNRRSDIVFEVEALGKVVTDGIKSCTDAIRIVRRMPPVAEGRLRYGYGYGYGNGNGYGYGDGNGNGNGDGNGYGYGYGYGNGNGNGYGYGDESIINKVLTWED